MKRGLHFHCLLSVPEELIPGLKREVEQSIWTIYDRRARRPAKPSKAALAANPFAGADDTKTVDFKKSRTVDLQWRRWRYTVKTVNPAVTVSVRDQPSWKPTPIRAYLALEKKGKIGRYTKARFGISKTLGPKARRAFEKKYRKKVPSALLRAEKPEDLYGPQYLDWSRENMREVPPLTSLELD